MEKTDIQPEKTEVNLNHVENEEMAVDIADQKSAYGEKTFTGEEEGGGKIKKSALERRLVRKLDLIIVPIAGLMYFTAYMVRITRKLYRIPMADCFPPCDRTETVLVLPMFKASQRIST